MQDDPITYFAETDARNRRVPFGIKESDRSRHIYVIGKTGMGKSTMLENMAVQDIKNGAGMAFIDPHGKTADLLLDYVPQERIKDIVYFAPFDLEYPVSFNVMEDVGHEKRHLVANGLMSAFKKIWVDAWSARMEYILNNVLLALLEYPDATLIGVNRMLVDKDYRKKVVENITDPSVKSFWNNEFAKYGDRYMQEAGAAIQNKIGQFISNPLVRNIIGQPKSTFDIRKIMDEKKILIINLSKGRVGEANANLLGSMLITKIYLAAMSRADASPGLLKKLPSFNLYVDEFQSFANESFADILSEARKYKLSLVIAHQYIEQMSDEVRAAVFGNVGTMVTFRIGAFDAEIFEKEFAPSFTEEDLVNLGFAQIYLKLMIDGVTSSPFSAVTLPPIEKPLVSFKEDIIRSSRQTYARPRSEVEEYIRQWHETKPEGKQMAPVFEPREARAISAPSSHAAPSAPPRREREREPRSQSTNTEPRNLLRGLFPQNPVTHAPASTNTTHSTSATPLPVASPAQQSDKRENDLRKAVTENYARNAAEKKKTNPKREKGPTPQNLSALRDALASVIKEANVLNNNSQQSAQAQAQVQAEPQPKTQPAPQVAKPKQQPQQVVIKTSAQVHPSQQYTEPIHHKPESNTHTHQNQEEKVRARVEEAQKAFQEDLKKPREVPEAVLKKILEIDK